MHEISWWVISFYSIPQFLLYVYLGFQLVNYQPPLPQMLIISLIYSPFIYVIRRIDLPFGFHTIILTVIVIILVHIFLRLPIIICTIAVLIGSITALSLESFLLPLIIKVSNTTFNEVISSDFYSIAFSAPQIIILFIINVLIWHKNIYIFSLNKGAD